MGRPGALNAAAAPTAPFAATAWPPCPLAAAACSCRSLRARGCRATSSSLCKRCRRRMQAGSRWSRAMRPFASTSSLGITQAPPWAPCPSRMTTATCCSQVTTCLARSCHTLVAKWHGDVTCPCLRRLFPACSLHAAAARRAGRAGALAAGSGGPGHRGCLAGRHPVQPGAAGKGVRGHAHQAGRGPGGGMDGWMGW